MTSVGGGLGDKEDKEIEIRGFPLVGVVFSFFLDGRDAGRDLRLGATGAGGDGSVRLPICTGLFFRSIFWKYFCACVRTCTTVRVPIMVAIVFHCLPCFSRPSRKARCSSSVHLPTFSEAAIAALPDLLDVDFPLPDDAREAAATESLGITTRGGTERIGAILGGAGRAWEIIGVAVMVKVDAQNAIVVRVGGVREMSFYTGAA